MFWRKLQVALSAAATIALLLALAMPLMAGGYPGEPTSYLGIDTRDVTADRLGALKLKEERGVEVTMVDQDAPAGKAGVREHDVILSFNGQPVESVEELRRMIRETPPGRAVTLGISRDGQPLTLQATLADRRRTAMMAHPGWTPETPEPPEPPEMPEMPEMPNIVIPRIEVPQFEIRGTTARAGLVVENLTPQLAQYFGCRNGEGVLVRSVEKGSAAAAAGFKAGDVIVRIDKDKVTDINDLRMSLRQHRSGKVPVGILREKKEQTLTLALSLKDRSANVIELPDMSATMEELDRQMELLGPEIERTAQAATQVTTAELARQQVELNKAMNEARKQAYKELKRHRKEIEKARKEAEKAARQAQKEIESSMDDE